SSCISYECLDDSRSSCPRDAARIRSAELDNPMVPGDVAVYREGLLSPKRRNVYHCEKLRWPDCSNTDIMENLAHLIRRRSRSARCRIQRDQKQRCLVYRS